MNETVRSATLVIGLLAMLAAPAVASESKLEKPSPGEAIKMLKEGDQRFVTGKSIHPHIDAVGFVFRWRRERDSNPRWNFRPTLAYPPVRQ